MAKPEGLSCPLCLMADEPESMVPIFIPHHLLPSEKEKLICRECAAMISVAWRKLEDDELAAARPDDPADEKSYRTVSGDSEPVELSGSAAFHSEPEKS